MTVLMYFKYLLLGERTTNMNSSLVALCDTIRIVALLFIGALAQGFSNNFARGDYTLNWTNVQTFIMPVVIVLLNYGWKFARDFTNPVIPLSAVETPPHAPLTLHAQETEANHALDARATLTPDLPDPSIPKE